MNSVQRNDFFNTFPNTKKVVFYDDEAHEIHESPIQNYNRKKNVGFPDQPFPSLFGISLWGGRKLGVEISKNTVESATLNRAKMELNSFN